ncbi:MAG: phosphoribosylanthranilate isomerase, partial [Methanosphaera sp.]|nr:phosphoribosylanthranilate isomerase [Methanosphaera sp.]
KVKICGITKKNDLKKIEKLDYDKVGFINIERSKRNVSMNRINQLEHELNHKRSSTLVLEPDNAYDVILKCNRLKIYNIQLHSLSSFDIRYIKWINQYHNFENLNITRAIGIKDTIDESTKRELIDFSSKCDNILLDYVKDGLTGGTNTQIPIDTAIEAAKIIKNTNKHTEVSLAGGLNYEYLEGIYDQLKYFDRIDLNSGVEFEPGCKDINAIKRILKLFNN